MSAPDEGLEELDIDAGLLKHFTRECPNGPDLHPQVLEELGETFAYRINRLIKRWPSDNFEHFRFLVVGNERSPHSFAARFFLQMPITQSAGFDAFRAIVELFQFRELGPSIEHSGTIDIPFDTLASRQVQVDFLGSHLIKYYFEMRAQFIALLEDKPRR